MLRSFYIAGTGMYTQRARMDVIINNLTNSDTVGYKKDEAISRSFDDLLITRLNDEVDANNGVTYTDNGYVGPLNTGVYFDEISTSFVAGPVEITDIPTDFAITGEGFFAIQTPNGERYTRSGNFQVDINGNLLTQEGYYVMSETGGFINVGTEGDFSVSPDGTVSVAGTVTGKMRIVEFEDTSVLRKEGSNLFYADGGTPTVMQAPTLLQGAVEGSNVDLGREMADMLVTNRAYETSQQALQMIDESLEKTVNEIGRF